ncbi:T-cell-interacting, activating receptor on myeloid cells protein 1-like isoform X2 [Phascolarctos cinereus]|uniref:T-cell-interacting, activating receptor on myeloid cells protein 1-like isoform X3 n=1 Tax=Phascolarctos cinereus TaxID=38626 RepID=UPI000A28244D|nr:T-cell-interacting, activating receptor on myeloid cells protein 1-like isoform X3 [Phascolarctos cinereus]
MAPRVTSLLCLGLCLSQKITAPEGTLPTPSIRAVPSSVVPKEARVSFYCQGPQGSRSFQLWKDEAFLLQINTSREEAAFRLQPEGLVAAGSYSCRYWQGSYWSEFSAPLQLVVTGFFSRPSLQVRPSTMVAVGETVTLVCQELLSSGFLKLTFFLLKTGVPAPLQHQSPEGKMASFTLPSVKAEDAGNYSCIYSSKGTNKGSDPSDVLRLEVTGKKTEHPQGKELGIILIVTVSCVSVFFLLLCLLVFLCRRRTQHRSSCGDTHRRSSDSAGVPQSLCLTSLPPKETMCEDISKRIQLETQASESEDSQGVTYSQLNTAALDEGQRVLTSAPPEPSVYATLALR